MHHPPRGRAGGPEERGPCADWAERWLVTADWGRGLYLELAADQQDQARGRAVQRRQAAGARHATALGLFLPAHMQSCT